MARPSRKWAGQCADCGAWNTPGGDRRRGRAEQRSGRGGWAGQQANLKTLAEVSVEEMPRFTTGSTELDRVLGGGLVDGSVVLIGGDPGIRKSTILLQTLCNLASRVPALYVTGEESQQRVAMRARRLSLPEDKLKVMTETSIETIIATARPGRPRVMVIDSIQTIFTEQFAIGAGWRRPGPRGAAMLVRLSKQSGTAIFLVGHVTKEGACRPAGARDTWSTPPYCISRANQTAACACSGGEEPLRRGQRTGVFGMTDKGLKEVSSPSAIFLTRGQEAVPGSVVMATWEGSRPMLVEVQALVDAVTWRIRGG
ncbi:ATPase domain-containing protein [Pseudomonas aeruginosa]